MARHKDEDKKQFLIAARKKIGPSISAAPVWVMQKAKKRIWNKRRDRHWRSTHLGALFEKKKNEQKGFRKRKIKSGWKAKKGVKGAKKRKSKTRE